MPTTTLEVTSAEPAASLKFYTVAEAADILRVCVGTIHRMLKDGQLIGIRPGTRTIIIPETSIKSWTQRLIDEAGVRAGNTDNVI
jgi:excisionase family DNA binding protein